MRKKIMLLITCILVISGLSGCSKDNKQMKEITEDELTEFQGPVLDFINKDNAFGVNGCYSKYDEDSGMNTMFIEAYEELGFEYEAYKKKIWDEVGAKFNIAFELIPFPENPTISGIIRDIDYDNQHNRKDYVGTILVVSQISEFISADGNPYFDASHITVTEDVDIVNNKGEMVEFSELKEGMMVDSYYRGMTLTTYPGQQGTEKLVVYENYEMPIVKDQENDTVFINKFDSVNYTGPYPVVVEGYKYEMIIDEWKSKIIFYMDSGMVYYDIEKGFDDPQLYSGRLKWTFIGENDTYMTGKVDGALLLPNDEIVVYSKEENELSFQIPVFENDEKGIAVYKIDKTGTVERTD